MIIGTMKVILAQSSGFCFGVKRAVDLALHATRSDVQQPLYTDGPLIHNPQALAVLSKKGVTPLEMLPARLDGTIIVRSHGITPQRRETLEKTGATIVDATCPKVRAVQSIIQDHAHQGYIVIIVGEAHHAEVQGLLGYAGAKGIAIETEKDLPELPPDTRLCVVAQTTQNRENYLRLAEAIKKRFPRTEVFDTICNANRRRQEELLELCPIVNAIVVLGGRESGNTKRLAEIARATGTPTFFAETKDDLSLDRLKCFETIGVIGGASTPEWVIQDVVKTLEHLGADAAPA
ncbi:MAG TPA: 4-hydroxy-3-methylbut-2-enyl diphosphate reductase [Thermodesulfobacteriota bacterium]|nr:4-hydroxy-3-methylbut-2-enyl diphosphate reductase [Thermodesulfobacteriota bacterium]